MTAKNALVWFRRDLRIEDHAALHNALLSQRPVYCVFVFDKDILAGLPVDDRRVHFIYACVQELDAKLRSLGSQLIVRHGSAVQEILQLANDLDVESVFVNRDYEPSALARDRAVERALRIEGRSLQSFKDQVIFEHDEVTVLAGGSFSVFTPYKNAWLKRLHSNAGAIASFETLPYASGFARCRDEVGNDMPALTQLGFQAPTHPLEKTGMAGAAQVLEAFASRLARYDTERDFPALDSTSRLSPHLRFGTVSIRSLVRLLVEREASGAAGSGDTIWRSELIWRDFYMMILARHPRVVTQAFKPAFDRVQWETGQKAVELFEAWCAGQTGYPLVDAAMAQLNQTGYMHNRLRMVVASFLTKDLGIDWRSGERYFAEQLLDYDLAANNGGWQWAASTGCDAQPWFRIFNPVTQSQRFDPQGSFIRKWVPQLALLSNHDIHSPWTASPIVLQGAGISLGKDYPLPVVDHQQAREQTLARYGIIR